MLCELELVVTFSSHRFEAASMFKITYKFCPVRKADQLGGLLHPYPQCQVNFFVRTHRSANSCT